MFNGVKISRGKEIRSQMAVVKRLPVGKELAKISLMFLVHPTHTEENMGYVVEQVKEVMSHAKAEKTQNGLNYER